MGNIGSFGGVAFEVSSRKILTPNDISRSGAARWESHQVIGKKPMPEFLGPDQEGIPFKLTLRAAWGVNPRAEMDKLWNVMNAGKVGPFIIGTKPLSSSYWYIESISESYPLTDKDGNILSIDADISLKEYPVIKTTKAKPTPKPTTSTNKSTATSTARKALGSITIKAQTLYCRSKPALNGPILTVLRYKTVHTVYGTKQTDILWYDLGNGKYCSANSKYVTFKKG